MATCDPPPVLMLGDTQRTAWAERVFLGREDNEYARRRLLAAASAERFGLFVHLGDAVFDGGSAREWSVFDRLAGDLLAPVPALLVPGNHDYWGGAAGVRRHAAQRFDNLGATTWSVRRYDSLALVLLDSNRRRLGAQWSEQRRWYAETMAEQEEDPRIRDILVCAHHPPCTNSRASGDSRHVRQAFLGPFLDSGKTRAFLSGHAHGYERFERAGKWFIVSGGGGGPRVRYRVGRRTRHRDGMKQADPAGPRPFHYLLVSPRAEGGLDVVVKGFLKDEPVRLIERITL